jgi:predicted transcriptional regulator of viral defense system
MLYKYSELLKTYKSRHQIEKAVLEKKLFKVAYGFYSDDKDINNLEIITRKYPNAVFTLNSAYSFYDLTDVTPVSNYLAIEKHQKIKEDSSFKIYYLIKDLHELGITKIERQGAIINIYDKEKLLIELVRNKNKFGYDYYKEIIRNYRKIIYDLDISKVEKYLNHYKNKSNLLRTIQDEVY